MPNQEVQSCSVREKPRQVVRSPHEQGCYEEAEVWLCYEEAEEAEAWLVALAIQAQDLERRVPLSLLSPHSERCARGLKMNISFAWDIVPCNRGLLPRFLPILFGERPGVQ